MTRSSLISEAPPEQATTPHRSSATDVATSAGELELPRCARGVGSVVVRPDSQDLIAGVKIEPLAVWPDDRGYFLEVFRSSRGLAKDFARDTVQVSATLTYPGTIKAFHFHIRQDDCWTPIRGLLQVALVDLRRRSPTFGWRNTLFVGELRPWQILIPTGVAHGYKVVGPEPAMLVYATSRFYDPNDEGRIPYDDTSLNYDWSTQYR